MTTFVTNILALYTRPLSPSSPDHVYDVIWEVDGWDASENECYARGHTHFDLGNGTQGVPFATLTLAQVIDWINPQDIANAQANVQGQLDSMGTPPVSPESQVVPE